jgi:two-component system, cell cycle sensor histidine kinase and response regulator CckA
VPRKYYVLLVDDSLEQAELIQDFLNLEGDYVLEWANDVHALWNLIDKRKFDIILLDYRLPETTGLDVLKTISSRGYHIPVVMVTGQGDERIATQALQNGASDYIVKNPDYVFLLPSTIKKVVEEYELKRAVDLSLEKIRYQAFILNNVRDAVVVWDVNAKITFWNSAACKLFGWTSDQRQGFSVQIDYFSKFEPKPDLKLFKNKEVIEEDRKVLLKNGNTIWINSRITKLKDPEKDGETIGYMDVSRDITDSKRMEAEIKGVQSHLIQSARLSAIGELASGIAHRISNPLAVILANSHLILHNLSHEHPFRESLEDIQKAGWNAQKTVKSLLDFSRPMSGAFEPISINDTITEAIDLVGAQIENELVRLTYQLEPNLPMISGNRRQLDDLWVNLLLLARDASMDEISHVIQIRTKKENETIIIEVQDDGSQIPHTELNHIFEPNFINSKTGRGTGMELSICREIVKQHKGQISAISEYGQTVFQIMLPIQTEPAVSFE